MMKANPSLFINLRHIQQEFIDTFVYDSLQYRDHKGDEAMLCLQDITISSWK